MYTFFAVLITFACPVMAQVVINEVLYDPDGTDTGKEKIEIRNVGSTAVDLTGYDLYPDGTGYFTFPSASLAPGAIAVVHLRQTGIQTGSDYFHPAPSSNMGNSSGSVALFSGAPHNTGTLVRYVQWGAGGNGWASTAVSAGVWTAVSDSVPAVSEGHSLEYDGSGFTPGDWFDQIAPTLGLPNALPVQLISFSGRRIGTSVFLSWETLSEIDNFGFEIERRPVSPKGSLETGFMLQDSSHETSNLIPANAGTEATWNRVGFVPGGGTSQVRRRYSFVDSSPYRGKSVYRLRQMDRGGTFSFSNIIEVDRGERSESMNLDCYPNPFNPSTQLRFSVPFQGDVLLRVFDTAGRTVETLYSGATEKGVEYTVMLRGQNLASGVYVASCEFQGKRTTRKILLIR